MAKDEVRERGLHKFGDVAIGMNAVGRMDQDSQWVRSLHTESGISVHRNPSCGVNHHRIATTLGLAGEIEGTPRLNSQ